VLTGTVEIDQLFEGALGLKPGNRPTTNQVEPKRLICLRCRHAAETPHGNGVRFEEAGF
jgi:hypothetical protein